MLTDEQITSFMREMLGIYDIDSGQLVFVCTDDFLTFARAIEKAVRDEMCKYELITNDTLRGYKIFSSTCGIPYIVISAPDHHYCRNCGKKIEVV